MSTTDTQAGSSKAAASGTETGYFLSLKSGKRGKLNDTFNFSGNAKVLTFTKAKKTGTQGMIIIPSDDDSGQVGDYTSLGDVTVRPSGGGLTDTVSGKGFHIVCRHQGKASSDAVSDYLPTEEADTFDIRKTQVQR